MPSSEKKPSSKIVLIGLAFPIILIAALDYSINGSIPNFAIDDLNPRVANSALTAFILASTVLLGNMFFYGESRNRPLSPIIAMIIAVSVGVLATIFFINQGPMLLEGNVWCRAVPTGIEKCTCLACGGGEGTASKQRIIQRA